MPNLRDIINIVFNIISISLLIAVLIFSLTL